MSCVPPGDRSSPRRASYELSGANEMTMRPIVAKNPAAMAGGFYTVFSYKLEGNTIQVTTVRDQKGPIPIPVTIKAVRIE